VKRLLATSSALLLLAACGSTDDDTSSSAAATAAAPVATQVAESMVETTVVPATEPAAATTPVSAPTASTAVDVATMVAAINSVDWPDNVSVSIDEAAGTWTITTNGRPAHELPDQYLLPKAGVDARTVTLDILEIGNTPNQEVSDSWTLSLTPEVADSATNLFGPVAIATSGGWINDPYEGDQKTIALESNFTIDGIDFLDDCSGHFNPMGYHYHGIPYCMTAEIDTAGQHSALLGFAADGFPVYGPQGDDGSEVTGLDECRGEFGPTPELPQGIYHYHLTTTFPYTTLCLSGTVSESAHAGH
jgi:hypothetical protein